MGQRGCVEGHLESGLSCILSVNALSLVRKSQHTYRMEKQYYVRDLVLKNCPPFVEIIKKYFGLSHPNLELEMFLVPDDPERTYELTEYVLPEDIRKLIGDYFPKIAEKDKEFLTNLLWLVANLYYGDSYGEQREFIENEWNGEYNTWRCIEQDIIRLYAFLQDHPEEERITIQMGKDKVVLDDAFNWFQDVMTNQTFPNCIPHIHNKEEAQSFLRKKSGRPQTRKEVNAIVNGIAKYLSDENVIDGKAPKNLLEFIRRFLVMMALIEEDDVFVTTDWIKAQITNLQKQGKDARFENLDWVEVPADNMMESPWEKAMRWVFPPK